MSDEWITMEDFLRPDMNIKEIAVRAKIQMVSDARLKEFDNLIIEECIKVVKPTQYKEAYPDNMLGSYDGLKLLQLRVEDLERLKND